MKEAFIIQESSIKVYLSWFYDDPYQAQWALGVEYFPPRNIRWGDMCCRVMGWVLGLCASRGHRECWVVRNGLSHSALKGYISITSWGKMSRASVEEWTVIFNAGFWDPLCFLEIHFRCYIIHPPVRQHLAKHCNTCIYKCQENGLHSHTITKNDGTNIRPRSCSFNKHGSGNKEEAGSLSAESVFAVC